jgi:hypothetical protein
MNNETVRPAPMTPSATAIERLMFSEIGGMPVAIVACAVAAVLVGGLIAVAAGN